MCLKENDVFETKSFYLKQFQRFENNKVSPHQGITCFIKIVTKEYYKSILQKACTLKLYK